VTLRRLPSPALLLALPLLLAACTERSPSSGPSGSPSSPAAPPEAPPPAKQGTIEGVVRFKGKEPLPLQVAIPAELTLQCGELVQQPRVMVGKGGALAEVVVSVADAQGPLSAAPAPPPIDQYGCTFSPRVVAAAKGAQLTMINSDSLMHNVRSASGTDRPFNVAMPITGMKIQVPVASRSVVTRVTCDVHPWMVAMVHSFDHPYFAVTGEEGRFTIRGAPAGKGVLRLWHPFLGQRKFEVEVPEGGVARPQIDWPGPEAAKR